MAMHYKRKLKYVNYLVSLIALLMLFVVESCNNNKNNSQDGMDNMEGMEGMNGMDNMKNESGSKPDTTIEHDMEGMEGMDMNENNMEGMNKSGSVPPGFNDSLKIGSLAMPANYRVVSSQKSVKSFLNKGVNVIEGQGYISIDERRNNKVAARISGRIEKLYVKYNLQHVKKGEKIMKIYSPELNTYQEELLFLMKGNSDINLIDKAEEKLRLLGVSQIQIDEIKKTGNALFSIDVYSPQDGYVLFKSSATSAMSSSNNMSNGGNNGKMGGMKNAGNVSEKVISGSGQIREGNYVNKGDVLFWVNDLEEVWAMIAVDNSQQQELQAAVNVSLISELYRNDTIHTVINFIEPVYQPDQKFIIARIYLKNPDKKYKINSLVEAKISAAKTSSFWVPYSSVLFLGKRKIVWVLKERTSANNKIYEARDVITGLMHNRMVEIKSGLSMNEEIAVDAGYLLDRESLIKPE